MKVKTSVSLSEDLLRQIDERIAAPGRRSDFIESAVREHLARVARRERSAHEVELLNLIADGKAGERPDSHEYGADLGDDFDE